MKSYDCILNFSESESFSMVSFDALRFGIPLISTDCGGPAELMEPNKTGMLVKNKSTKEMYKAMLQLSKNIEWCQRLHQHSKSYLIDLYSKTNGYEYITEIYRKELNRYTKK
jgi:glycosyltransferase involved in cell wall biosynthesis